MGQQLRHYPPEWEAQKCVWLSWPHNKKEWKNDLTAIRDFYIELINKILDFQDVNLIFPDLKTLEKTKLSFKKKTHKCKKVIIPNNDVWIRDYGPFFVKQISEKKILNFEFNAWGKKFSPWNLDNNVPKEVAFYKGLEIESYPLVLEGGAVEFNGSKTALATEESIINKNRNPRLSRKQLESVIKSAFNLEKIIWIKKGLVGDHTDGHIDNVARFISNNKVLVSVAKDKKNKNHKRLEEVVSALKKHKLKTVELPLPNLSKQVPNSYANFIFVKNGIIFPTFNCKEDKLAEKIFKKVFPKRKIVGIDCSLLLKEGGGLHCITKQESL